MKTSSAKAKGRRLQDWVAKKISEVTGIKHGKDELIAPRPMGQSGTDIILIGGALEKFPFSVEAKCQEAFHLVQYIEQARANTKDGTDWLLVLSKNRFKPVVVIDAEVFFGLWEKYLKSMN